LIAATLREEDRQTALAARTAGVFHHVSDATLLEVRGRDAGRYLEAMCTRDLSGLDPGGLRYAALLDDRARLVADFWIWRVGEAWWLEVESKVARALSDRLNRFAVADEVEVGEREGVILVHLEGPAAEPSATAILGGGLTQEAVGARNHFVWARRSRFGHWGLTIATGRHLRHAWGSLQPASEAVQESLRIEAGRVRAGIDFSERDLVAEAGLWSAVSLGKGCFPGQEIVRRIVSRGEVRRRLVGFVEEESSGEGQLLQATSLAYSVTLGKRGGLGWVSAADAAPGTRVTVRGGDSTEALFQARVAALPLVSGPQGVSPDVPGEREENTAPR
jgi:folate-binding protein YgfZ